MIIAAAILFLAAFALSLLGVGLAKRYALSLGLMDDPGHRKVHTVATPRNGGIGIFLGFAVPLLVGIVVVLTSKSISPNEGSEPYLAWFRVYLPGMKAHASLALLLLAACFAIHLVGLLDDRKSMLPWPKLLLQLAIAAALVLTGECLAPGGFRVLTFLGNFPSPGFFLSALLSVLWIVALTNAFNFLDHMDGLSAGVAFISAFIFLIAATANGQWFICAMLLLFLGSVLGFLFYNFPPATIFMGDGGSMLLGFILAALTIRTTFLPPGATFANRWYALLAPVIILAVPLYDLIIVSVLRIARGRSPMQGDTNHFSHRLTRHGFTKRGAILVIYAVTLATGITAPLLARVDDTSAILLFAQLLGMLVVIGILERVGDHTD